MNTNQIWQGQPLQVALLESPSLILSFYSYGVTLRKQDGELTTEYPVDVRRAKRRE